VSERKVKCGKCGYIGDESEFPKGRDFVQVPYIASCPKKCGNRQTPGDASMRMFPGAEHPFAYVRADEGTGTPLGETLHSAGEAS